MTQWGLFKQKIADCKSSEEVTTQIRTTEVMAMEYCSRHLPEMTEFYKDNNPEAKRASIYGLEYFLRSEVEKK